MWRRSYGTRLRTLPVALAVGTGLVAVLYLVLNVVFIYAAPLETLKGEAAVGAARRIPFIRRKCGGHFRSADGVVFDGDRECNGDDRSAGVLRHG